MRWKLIAILSWVLVAAALAYRIADGWTWGGGRDVVAPDGSGVAGIYSFQKTGVLSKDKETVWVTISMEDEASGREQRSTYIAKGTKDSMLGRNSGTIEWSPDSRSVKFVVGGKETVFEK